MKISAGQLVCTSDGSYSDYGLRDHFRVLKDFDSAEVVARFRELHPRTKNAEAIESWLIREGYWEPTRPGEVLEWWLDIGYGRKQEWGEPQVRDNEYLREQYAKAVLPVNCSETK